MTICPQNGTLFNETIMYNIKYANPDCSDEEVIQITKDLGIYNRIITFENGFDTYVGTLGSKLSGGEKQRILLARSLLKPAEIIILDEPTSNLDNKNETLVMELLDKYKANRTIIICTHRLNTLLKCDTIHILSHGKIVESGSHEELIADSHSYYNNLYKNNIKQSHTEHGHHEEDKSHH